MTLRRALAASPLALVVAVFAHISAFGFSHVAGGEHAPELLVTLALALALGLALAFASGLLSGARAHRELGPGSWYGPLVLAAAGVACFGCIEYSEGHFLLQTLLEASVVSVPLAYAVAFVARATRRALRDAGATYGDFICRALPRAGCASARIAREFGPRFCRSFVIGASLQGRAPPAII